MSSYNKGLPPRDDRSKRSPAKGSKKPRKQSGGKTFFKVLLTILIVAVLGAGGVAGYLMLTLNDTINKTGTSGKVAAENSAKVKPIAMLLLGTDYRPETGTHLSDVIMVIAMNPKTKSATIVSLPRDTRFQMKGYRTNKLNSFYPKFLAAEKKSGISAKEEMKTMLSKYMDLPLDYTTVLNFQGFRDVVNALGGVDVSVDADMCYVDKADGTNINLKKGAQHLNGDKALDYVRYRKSNCKPKTKPSNDFERNQRQNEVLHALIDQTKSLNGVIGAGKAIESIGDNMTTDLESEQIKNIIAAYWSISKENVTFIPVTGDWKSPYVYINDSELNKAKQALKDELAGTKPQSEEQGNQSGK